jgi:hypothetical protein
MKWHLLTYKQKLRVMGLVAFVLIILSYQYGIKKTWVVYDEYSENSEKIKRSSQAALLLPQLKVEEKKINEIIKNNLSDTLTAPKETLAFITGFCKENQLRLIEYLPIQLSENSSYNIATRQISVEGVYADLLKLLYQLENNQFFGRLCSAVFKRTEDPVNDKIALTCTFFLQTLIQK